MYRKQESQKILKEKERKELEECTHRPQLNEISSRLSMQKRVDPQRKIENDLINYNKNTITKINKAKAQALEVEMQGCTFKPRINELSDYICNMKQQKDQTINTENNERPSSNNRKQRHELLFEKGKQKQFQKTLQPHPLLIDRNCTFQPEINRSSQNIRTSFNERFQKSIASKQEKEINQLREKLNDFKDKQTGQVFFRPQTGRNPLTERNSENLQINEYLYQQSRLYSNRKEREIAEKQKEKHSFQINENSKKIFQQIEDTRLREIFDQLDSDNDGQINAQNISIIQIKQKILELISPVLYEMEDFNFSLNYEEFSQAIKRLAKGYTSQQKSELYSYTKKKKNHKN